MGRSRPCRRVGSIQLASSSLEGEEAAMLKGLGSLLSCQQPHSVHKSDGLPGQVCRGVGSLSEQPKG